ncbi:hypothetical protein [Corynebacterium liangguodongii]|uniref:hypothetical protein n=1 Tax=Corynebacterium liangguodongii TaxID=2079535 RepID=UPI0015D09B4C|nr:hypothetical protein [Corynebacterium liangguodongii]
MRNLSYATAFAALSGFAVLWVAQRVLDIGTDYRYFAAYWSLFFASAGIIDGLTHETTRSVASDRAAGTANPWRAAGLIAALVAAASLALGVVLMGRVVPTAPLAATGILVFGLVSYVFQAALSGVLSGAGLWSQYAALVALDSGIRLAIAIAAWALGWQLWAFLALTVIGAVSWTVILGCSPRARGSIGLALDTHPFEFYRRVGSAMVASGASAAMITGFPVAASAAFPSGDGTTVAAVINAVILTRAPVLVPLQRFQSALVVRFVEKRERIYAALTAPLGAVLALGAVGFVAAWVIGPVILRFAFSPDLFVPGLTLGALTFASAFMGALMITGVAVLSTERHGVYVAGWVVATVVAFVLLFALPYGVVTNVCAALYAGPLAGAAVHAIGLRR